jgi:hypothetical protein
MSVPIVTTSPTAEINETGMQTLELPKRFLKPSVSDAVLESLTCRWVTAQVEVLTSAPFTSPITVPPVPMTFFPDNESTLTKKSPT